MKRLLLLAALLGLAGCAAKVVSSSARTVVVRAPGSAYAEAQKMGDAECSKFNRFARMVARPGPTSAEFIFDCVE